VAVDCICWTDLSLQPHVQRWEGCQQSLKQLETTKSYYYIYISLSITAPTMHIIHIIHILQQKKAQSHWRSSAMDMADMEGSTSARKHKFRQVTCRRMHRT